MECRCNDRASARNATLGEGGRHDRPGRERAYIAGIVRSGIAGDLDTISRHFASDCRFELAGSSAASQVAVKAVGAEQFGPTIAALMKIFEMSDLNILSIVVEGDKAAVHWRVKVRSSVTGDMAVTDLCDIVEFRRDKVASFLEFCDTAMAQRMMGPPETGRAALA